MPCVPVTILTTRDGMNCVISMVCMLFQKPMSNHMEWDMKKKHWRNVKIMNLVILNEISRM